MGPATSSVFHSKSAYLDRRDYQPDREHQAGDDAPAQLEPHRVERDLLTDPLTLGIAAEEIVRGDDQDHGHHHHEDVGLAGRGNERREMVGAAG